jgi:hypothetical protein
MDFVVRKMLTESAPLSNWSVWIWENGGTSWKMVAWFEALGRKHGGTQHWGMFDDLRASDVAAA